MEANDGMAGDDHHPALSCSQQANLTSGESHHSRKLELCYLLNPLILFNF